MAEVSRAVKEANELFQKFTQAYRYKQHDECAEMITKLKRQFIKFPTFLNPSVQTPTRAQEVMLVRETQEHAVLLAAATKNMVEFGRNFEILRTYYNDYSDQPPSERRLLILGLNLLRLLASNDVRQFHQELEQISTVDQDNMYIKDVVQLERYLMEGSYNKMLQARKKVPSNDYAPLMDMLLETVQREVFQCASDAYESLSIEGARKLLMFDTTDALLAFIKVETARRKEAAEAAGETWKETWVLEGDHFHFVERTDKTQRRDPLPFLQIMGHQLDYAHELQRIV